MRTLACSLIIFLAFINGFAQSDSLKDKRPKMVTFTVENDLLLPTHTDRYYTNGFDLSITTPKPIFKFQGSLLGIDAGYNTHSISISTQMFTPYNIREANARVASVQFLIKNGLEVPQNTDRPYAGLLLLNFKSEINDPAQLTRLTSQYSFGVLGPLSQQDDMQRWFHKVLNRPIPDWRNQLPNDVALNLNFSIDRALIKPAPYSEIIANLTANMGTVSNSVRLGSLLRFGRFGNYFKGTLHKEKEGYFFIGSSACLFYDNALLEGGVLARLRFQTKNAVPRDNIAHYFFEAQYGASTSFRNTRITYTQYMRTPEFKKAKMMYWGGLTFSRKI